MVLYLGHPRARPRGLAHGGRGARDQPLHVVRVVVGLQPGVNQLVVVLLLHSSRQQRPSLLDRNGEILHHSLNMEWGETRTRLHEFGTNVVVMLLSATDDQLPMVSSQFD